MNHHLLLFNFYGEEKDRNKENNLSRALALCLKNDTVLLNNFLNEILDPQEYKELFYNEDDFTVDIDVQKRIANIDNMSKLKAIALTPLDLTEKINSDIKPQQASDPITDIYIRIQDLAIIIEVKMNPEDCIAQLLGQVNKTIEVTDIEKDGVELKSLKWGKVIEIILGTKRYLTSLNKSNIFLDDFLKYIEERYHDYFPVSTLDRLPFTTDENNPTYHHIYRRLEIIKRQTKFGPLKEFQDRTAIPIDFTWANEAHIGLKKNPRNNVDSIGVHIWPGDTKQQGYSLFSGPLDWTEDKHILVDNNKYDLIIEPYLKFSHFTRGIDWIKLGDDHKTYASKTHTKEVFNLLAGRWWRNDWPRFETELGNYFDFDWQNHGGFQWKVNFTKSKRQYFDLSLGFALSVYIPYEKAVQLEKDSADTETLLLSDHLREVLEAIQKLVEGLK